MSVIVRPAVEADLPRIRELYLLFPTGGGSDSEWVSKFREMDSRSDVHLLVAELDGVVSGTCVLYVVPTLGSGVGSISYVDHVVVDEVVRGKGVGRALMDEVVSLVKGAGSYKVFVPSSFSREGAHRFYEQVGFEKTGFVFLINPK